MCCCRSCRWRRRRAAPGHRCRSRFPPPRRRCSTGCSVRAGRFCARSTARAAPWPRNCRRFSVPGFATAADYRLYTTPFNAAGHALQLAAPLAERREALREGMTGFLLPMLALLPLSWLLTGWIARQALAPMRALSAEIASRDGNRLDPIDTTGWPADLVQIAGTVNGFMARLTQALEAERAFATNAAHELRTPVAIALAQVQQLRAEAPENSRPENSRVDALERALQRMRRLVARLLQLARADAGVGASAQAHDIAALARLVVADVPARIRLDLPKAPVLARIDPDAFAIVLGNLVENALQHGAGEEIVVSVQPGPLLEVSNGGPVVPHLDTLPRRFSRGDGNGFGLGLHICGQIAAQAGGSLDLLSPRPGRADGFMARVHLRGTDG
ncbi:sensor histidine kinase [Paenirhodobacter sp.]|uniref:sensor histidine kinase n=1 Tax=Paenirhodobacter sp. TaxID=1965326 RepID=UPI003B412811